MITLDIVLLILLASAIFYGLYHGLIRMLGNFIGLILAAWLASHFYLNFYDWASGFIHINENIGKIVAFMVLFAIIFKVADILFALVEKIFNIVAIIPFMKLINRLLGGLLGLGLGSLILGLLIFVLSRYTIIETFFGQQLLESQVAPLLLKSTNIILPLLPQALKTLNSII